MDRLRPLVIKGCQEDQVIAVEAEVVMEVDGVNRSKSPSKQNRHHQLLDLEMVKR